MEQLSWSCLQTAVFYIGSTGLIDLNIVLRTV